MTSTTAYKQGDIVLVSFPFTDLTSSKTKLFTMHSSLVAKRICALRIEKMEEILVSLRRFFS